MRKFFWALSIVLLFTSIASIAHAGIGVGSGYQPPRQARSRPAPSFGFPGASGGIGGGYTIRQRPYALTPTLDWSDGRGNSGYIRQRPYSVTPTWDFYGPGGSQGTLRQRPYSITPTWDFGR